MLLGRTGKLPVIGARWAGVSRRLPQVRWPGGCVSLLGEAPPHSLTGPPPPLKRAQVDGRTLPARFFPLGLDWGGAAVGRVTPSGRAVGVPRTAKSRLALDRPRERLTGRHDSPPPARSPLPQTWKSRDIWDTSESEVMGCGAGRQGASGIGQAAAQQRQWKARREDSRNGSSTAISAALLARRRSQRWCSHTTHSSIGST